MSQERGHTMNKVDNELLVNRLCQLSLLEKKHDSSVDDDEDNQNDLCSITSTDDENNDVGYKMDSNHQDTFDTDDDDEFEQIVYVPPEEFSDWSNIGSIATSPPLTPTTTTLPLSQSASPEPSSPVVVPTSLLPTWEPVILHQPSAPSVPSTDTLASTSSVLLPPIPVAPESLLAQQKGIQQQSNIVHVTQKEANEEEGDFYLGISKDIWKRICKYLYPSDLTRLSTVNKLMYELVKDLDVWKKWYIKSLKSSKLALIPGLSDSHSFMLYMCSVSFQICELCLKRCNGNRQRGRLAAMPLPVIFSSSTTTSTATTHAVKSKANNKDQDDIAPQNTWTIRLCKACRVSHYTENPESVDLIPRGSYLLKRTIKSQYRLGDKEIKSIEDRNGGGRRRGKPVKYNERAAVSIARRVYGGDIGIHILDKSLSKPMSKVHHRVYLYHRRQKVLSEGKTWWSGDEFKARKVAGLIEE